MEEIYRGGLSYIWNGTLVEREWSGYEASWENGQVRLKFQTKFEDNAARHEVQVKGDVELRSLYLDLDMVYEEADRFLANGFQSWSETFELGPNDRLARLRSPAPKLMEQSGDYTFQEYARKPGYFHSHAFTYRRHGDLIDLITGEQIPGQPAAYTIFEWKLPEFKLRARWEVAGLELKGETARFAIREQQGSYADLLSESTGGENAVTGWTSWYNYYTDIDESIILENVKAFQDRKLPIDIFQIDDGWQPAVGDWLECNQKFPKGMRHLSDQIHAAGYKAGLWLAPYIVDPRSEIYAKKRDWLVSYDGEHLVRAGFNPGWGGWKNGSYYLLDIYNPEVKDYLQRVMDRVLNEWNFDMVKLDFLFAAALIPRNGKSRAMIMQDGMELLRDWIGDKQILGCGVPLESVKDKVEFCRIGADVGLTWETKSLEMINLRERISTQSSLRSTILRRPMANNYFRNDPDVFILRPENHKLSTIQQETLFIVNIALGELMFTSDNVSSYGPETLRLYQSQFPHRKKRLLQLYGQDDVYTLKMEIGDRLYYIAVNLSSKDVDVTDVPKGIYFERKKGLVKIDSEVVLVPFESRIFLATDPKDPILGSDGHLFPAADLPAWDNGIVNRLDKAVPRASAWVRVPKGQQIARVNGWEWPIEGSVAGINYAKVPMD